MQSELKCITCIAEIQCFITVVWELWELYLLPLTATGGAAWLRQAHKSLIVLRLDTHVLHRCHLCGRVSDRRTINPIATRIVEKHVLPSSSSRRGNTVFETSVRNYGTTNSSATIIFAAPFSLLQCSCSQQAQHLSLCPFSIIVYWFHLSTAILVFWKAFYDVLSNLFLSMPYTSSWVMCNMDVGPALHVVCCYCLYYLTFLPNATRPHELARVRVLMSLLVILRKNGFDTQLLNTWWHNRSVLACCF